MFGHLNSAFEVALSSPMVIAFEINSNRPRLARPSPRGATHLTRIDRLGCPERAKSDSVDLAKNQIPRDVFAFPGSASDGLAG